MCDKRSVNWKRLCRQPDGELLMLFVRTRFQSTLEGLRAGFPEYFLDSPEKRNGIWPRSLMRLSANVAEVEDWPLPMYHKEHTDAPIMVICHGKISEDIPHIFVDKEFLDGFGMQVDDWGLRKPITITVDGNEYYMLEFLDWYAYVIPVECVDMNA